MLVLAWRYFSTGNTLSMDIKGVLQQWQLSLWNEMFWKNIPWNLLSDSFSRERLPLGMISGDEEVISVYSIRRDPKQCWVRSRDAPTNPATPRSKISLQNWETWIFNRSAKVERFTLFPAYLVKFFLPEHCPERLLAHSCCGSHQAAFGTSAQRGPESVSLEQHNFVWVCGEIFFSF